MTLSEAIESFLSQLAVGKQPYTVKAYAVSLRRLQAFLAEQKGLPPTSDTTLLTVDHVIEFAKSLRAMTPATIRNYLSAVSEFYRFLFARRLILLDMAEHERLFSSLKQMRPRSSSLPHIPPDQVVAALIRAAAKQAPATRDRALGDQDRAQLRRLRDVALLEALKSSGMRLGEALGLRRGDLEYRTCSARVTGKGRKERIVYFDSTAWDSIQEYLQAREDGARHRSLAQLPVFAAHARRAGTECKPLTRGRVEQIFRSLSALAELDPAPTPHWFRHWFATRVLEQTHDLAAVQDLLGHESPVTTRIYARVSSRRLRQVHQATFGRSDPSPPHSDPPPSGEQIESLPGAPSEN